MIPPAICSAMANEVRRKKLTMLSPAKQESLYRCMNAVLESKVPGDFAEFGLALGGSGICLAHALDGDRRFFGFDVFGMIPPPTEIDGKGPNERYRVIAAGGAVGLGGDKYYGYVDNLYDVVSSSFAEFGCVVDGHRISLVKGLFQETLPLYGGIRVALAHIDCDWYDPVMLCLDYVWQRMPVGGYIVLDDYNDWDGCRKATNDFLARHSGAQVLRTSPHCVVTRTSLSDATDSVPA